MKRKERQRIEQERQDIRDAKFREMNERSMQIREGELKLKIDALRVEEEQNIRRVEMDLKIAKLYTNQNK